MKVVFPVSGRDAGFSSRDILKVMATVYRKAQAAPTPQEEEDYFSDLVALPVKSSSIGEASAEGVTEVVRDPGSPWGGRERVTGIDYQTEVNVVLEGDVRYPYGGTDEEISKAIAAMFDEAWEENAACSEAVSDAKAEMDGEVSVSHSTDAQSISKLGDKLYKVVLVFSAEVSSSESEWDARARARDEQGEHDGDLIRDEGG